ncbi:MAG: LamG domain-containing protein, partial [Burkholderiales bacterium]|nr:LamG domain-containing protein [Burkholderiales bacterium]
MRKTNRGWNLRGAVAEGHAGSSGAPRLKALSDGVRKALTAVAAPSRPVAPRLQFDSFEPRVLMSGDGVVPQVNGRIDVPGEVDRYTFTLPSDVKIVFDSLTPDSQLQWSLQGPQGQVTAPRALDATDANAQSGNIALNLRAGTYTLQIDGVGDHVADYSFRIIDLSRATAITPGQVVNGTLTPANETDAYSFNAVAGQTFYFDALANANGTDWRLIGPDGKTVFGPSAANTDVENQLLTQTGAYTLLVEGRIGNGAANTAYSFNVQPVQDAQSVLQLGQSQISGPAWQSSPLGGALQLGGVNSVQCPASPELDLGRTVTMEAWVTVDRFTNSYMPIVYKGGADSTLGGHRTYALFVTNGGDVLLSTGDGSEQYLFSSGGLIKAGQRTHVAASIDRNSGLMKIFVNGTEVASGAVRTNTNAFSAAAQPLFIGRTDEPYGGFSPFAGSIDDLRIWKTARSGADIAANMAAELSGTQPDLVLNYRFNESSGSVLQDSGPLGLTGAVINPLASIEGAITGRIATPGQRAVYTLDLTDPRRVVFDALRDSPMNWSLAGPRGLLVNARGFDNSDSRDRGGVDGVNADPAYYNRVIYDLGPGHYTLTVDATGDTTGEFAFRLLDLGASALPLTVDTTTSFTLPVGSVTQAWSVNVAAGDRLSFNHLAAGNIDLQWRLVSPTGEQVWSSYFGSDIAERTYTQAGTYTLLVEGRRTALAPNAISFKVAKTGNTFAERVAGFDLDFGGPSLDPVWQPGGVPNTLSFNGAPSYSFDTVDGASVIRLNSNITGQYRGTGWATATNAVGQGFSYEVRFNTLVQSAATGFDELIGLSVTDMLDPTRWVATALASNTTGGGRKLAVDSRGVGGSYYQSSAYDFTDNTWYRLRLSAATDGTIKATLLSDAGAELTTLDLGITAEAFAGGARFGIYQSNTTTGGTAKHDVAIDWARLTTTPAAVQPLTLGQLVTGNRSAATQRDVYSFSLSQPTLVVLDTRENSSATHWTLMDDRGTVDSGSWFDWPTLPLKAGNYTLRIDGNTTGAYGFRLVDLGAAPALPLGQVVTGNLTPGYGVQTWSFDATAGQRLFFDARLYLDAEWRLVGPSGDQVFSTSAWDDREISVAQSGRYTLVLNGYNSHPAPQAYAFRVGDTGDRSTDITLAQGADTTPVWVPGAPGLGGSGLELDSRRELVVPDGAATDLRNDVTFEAWIRPDRFSNTWQPIAIKSDTSGQRTYSLWLNSNGYIHLSTFDSVGEQWVASANGSIQLGAWTHVAAVIDRSSGQLRLYINGVLAGQKDGIRTQPAVASAAPLRIGNTVELSGSYSAFDGAIDEARLWSVARTGQQISDNFGKTLTGSQAGLALRLGMEEGTGNSVSDSGPQALVVPIVKAYDGVSGVIQGTLANPGQTDRYRFTVTQPTWVALDSLTNSYSAVKWSLSGPQGVIGGANLAQSDANDGYPVYQLQPGDYVLTLDAAGDATAPYALRLLDLGQAAALPALPIGSVVSGTLQPASETLAYQFQATAGQKYFFDQLGNGGGEGVYRLVGPGGQQVWVSNLDYDVDTFAVPTTGTYTLLVEGRRNAPRQNSFSFRLVPQQDVVTPITLGSSVGVAPQLAPGYLGNALQADAANYVQVPDGPSTDLRGDITVEAWINPTRFSSNWMPIVAKDDANLQRAYTLWVNADGSIYGDTRDASGLQGARSVTGLVATNTWTHVAMVIDRSGATPRIRLFVNGAETQLSSGGALRSAQAIDTAGTLRVGNAWFGDTSTYQFDGRIDEVRLWSVARSAAQLQAARNAPLSGNEAGLAVYLPLDSIAADGSTPQLVGGGTAQVVNSYAGLNGVIAGTLAKPGQTDTYQFTVSQRMLVMADSLTNAYGVVNWRLTGPGGLDVTRNLNATDAGNGYPMLDLLPGTYTLSFDATSDNTSPYALRLLPLSALPTLTPGADTTGTLAPGSRTDGWRFQGQAGASYFFDAKAFSTADGRVRLISPYGTEVWATSPGTDVDSFTLPVTGEYTLLIEGLRNNTGLPSTYSFNLQPVVNTQRTLVIGQGQPFSPAWQGSGNGLALDGTQWLQAPADAALNLRHDVTLEAWIKPEQPDQTWTTLFYKGDGNTSQRTYSLWLNRDGRLHLSTGDGSNRTVETPTGTVQWGQWQHVAAVIDRDTKQLRILVNGVEKAKVALSGNDASSSSAPLVIGQARSELSTGYATYQGLMRDVRVWSTARSNVDIAAGAATPPAAGTAGLVLNYALDETAGTVLVDRAGQGLNGSLAGLYDTLPDTVRGRIASPGQQVVYTINVDATRRVVFDTLSDINFNWSLSGPDGKLVDARGFGASDSNDKSGTDGLLTNPADGGRVVYELRPGTYTLTVDAPGDNTGDFAFRLIDLAAATPVSLGTPLNLTLEPGNATRALSFNVTAGDRLFFDQLTASTGGLRWRLISPSGDQLWNANFSGDIAARTYLQGGTYTLLLEGYRNNSNPNSLGLQITRQGNTLAERIAGVDDSFDGALPGPNWVQQGSNLTLSADTIDGASVVRMRTIQTTYQTGNMLQSVGNVAGQGVSYEVRFNTLTQAPGVSTDEFIGLYLQNSADSSRNVWVNLFSDAAGNRQFRSGTNNVGGVSFSNPAFAFGDNTWYRLRLEAPANGNLRAVLLSDAGVELASRDLGVATDAFADGMRFSIYQFDSMGGPAHPSEVAVDWARLTTTPAAPQPISLGQLVTAEHSGSGDRDLYTFTVAQTTQVVMDPRNDNGGLQWTLTGERGPVGSLNFQQRSWDYTANPVMTLTPGTYTVTINGTSGLTNYGFRLLDLSAAAAITPGTPKSATLSPGNSTDTYQFTATAGERFYFDAQQVANGDSTWRLIAPNGQQRWVTGLGSDVDTGTLDQTGTWTLIVEGRRYQAAATNTYRINVQKVTDIVAPLTLGERTEGTLTQTGQQARYSFTLDQRKQLLMDTLNNADFNWTLTGPLGTVVNARSLRGTDAWNISGDPSLNLVPGSYTLTIDASADDTGTFAFRLLDMAVTTPITPGTPFTATLSSGTETQLYSFTANAGDKFYFDAQQITNNNGDWRLYGPGGNLLTRVDYLADLDVQTLREAGTYTLAVEGRSNSGTANALRMLVQPLPDVAPVRITGLEYQPAPDVIAQNLQVTGASGSLESGGGVTVSWTDRNDGTRPTASSWRDRVVVSRADTGEVLATVLLPYDAGSQGPLAAGAD